MSQGTKRRSKTAPAPPAFRRSTTDKSSGASIAGVYDVLAENHLNVSVEAADDFSRQLSPHRLKMSQSALNLVARQEIDDEGKSGPTWHHMRARSQAVNIFSSSMQALSPRSRRHIARNLFGTQARLSLSSGNQAPSEGRSASIGSEQESGTRRTCQALNGSCVQLVQGKRKFCQRHYWRTEIPEPVLSDWEQVTSEVLSSEKSYCDGLRSAIHAFQQPLLQLVAEKKSPLGVLMTEAEIGDVFFNINDIWTLQRTLLEDLLEVRQEAGLEVLTRQLARSLLHYVTRQSGLYKAYMLNYDAASKLLTTLRQNNENLEFFLQWMERTEGSKLSALLITPIQRLPRYLLLLKELIKILDKCPIAGATPDQAQRDLSALQHTVSTIAAVMAVINDEFAVRDMEHAVRDLALLFEHDARYEQMGRLDKPGRVLIKDGQLQKHYARKGLHLTSAKHYNFFLFNDMLVYATTKRNFGKITFWLKHHFSLQQIDKVEAREGAQLSLFFTDTTKSSGNSKGSESLLLQASSVEERDKWIRAISTAKQDNLKEVAKNTARASLAPKAGKLLLAAPRRTSRARPPPLPHRATA